MDIGYAINSEDIFKWKGRRRDSIFNHALLSDNWRPLRLKSQSEEATKTLSQSFYSASSGVSYGHSVKSLEKSIAVIIGLITQVFIQICYVKQRKYL